MIGRLERDYKFTVITAIEKLINNIDFKVAFLSTSKTLTQKSKQMMAADCKQSQQSQHYRLVMSIWYVFKIFC